MKTIHKCLAILASLGATLQEQVVGAANSIAFTANQITNPQTYFDAMPRHIYDITCVDANGDVRWTDQVENLVVNTGLNEILDKFWKGSSYTAAHYVGLTDGTPTVAASDTMSSHAGWAEPVPYSQGARPTLTLGTVAGQSVDNSASKAVFSVTGTAVIGGIFIPTDSTKSGTSGVLVGGGAFSGGDKSVSNGDTLNVTVTLSMTSS